LGDDEMEIIRVENISRDFTMGRDTVHALKNVNVEIKTGTFTILRGRSGSGKTTLINLMGALDLPTMGKIQFLGSEITGLSEKERDTIRRNRMGFVFQSIAIISTMTAYENIDFGLRLSGYSPKERRARVEECLHSVSLGKRMHHMPAELSGGEQQRVAIARAIAHKPSVVFADEPTAELDTHTGLQIVRLFKLLIEKEGLTVLMTTHDPEMLKVADEVYTLNDGEIIEHLVN
jgi:putative ABC transport system ATP-binding protein